MREIVLDTETTGIGPDHRVIEVGCVELMNRLPTGNTFHAFINPERKVDPGAFRVHGISDDFLKDKPKFLLVAPKLVKFIGSAPLVAHNAAFDKQMLDREFDLLGVKLTNEWIDTLPLARQAKPGGKHNLDVLLKHYGIGNANRKLHGALLDAQLLSEVYLHLRGGRQFGMDLAVEEESGARLEEERPYYPPGTFNRPRITQAELEAHIAFVATLKTPIWNDYVQAKEDPPELAQAA